MIQKRETGLDIVRAVAVIFVVCEHFYLSCGYYNTPLISIKLYIMSFFRWAFLAAVPLFMLLTGYFKKDKEISKKHYMSLVPVLAAYIVITVFRMLVENKMYGKIHSLESAVKSILNYQSAWYIGMYVSVIVLIPFLNKMWKGCKNEREHLFLIVSLAFISMLYPLVLYVAPSYWQMLYPIAYYFAGAYISTYKPHPNKLLVAGVFCLSVLLETVISVVSAKGGWFVWSVLGGIDSGNNAITVAVSAVCVFLMFYDIDIKNSRMSGIFKSIAGCSLEIYLFQTAVNAVLYTYVGRKVASGANNYFWLFFVLVPASFIVSWILAIVYKFIYMGISKSISVYRERKSLER